MLASRAPIRVSVEGSVASFLRTESCNGDGFVQEKYLKERIKVAGKTQNFGKDVALAKEKNKIVKCVTRYQRLFSIVFHNLVERLADGEVDELIRKADVHGGGLIEYDELVQSLLAP